MGLQSPKPHGAVPIISPFFVDYGGHGGKCDEACSLLFLYTTPGKQFVYAFEGTKEHDD